MKNSGVETVHRLVLDTSAYSHMRAGHEVVIELVAMAQTVLVPVTVLGELEGAFQFGRKAKENRIALVSFLDEPFVSILPSTTEVARRYGQVYAILRKAGTPIPVNDMWIAAATIDCGGRLLSFDQHYERIESLDRLVLSPI